MGNSSAKHKQAGAARFVTHHGASLHVQFGDSNVPTLRVLGTFEPAQVIQPEVAVNGGGRQQEGSPAPRGGSGLTNHVGVSALAVSPTRRDADRQYSLATGAGDGAVRLYCSSTERNYLTLWHGRRGTAVRAVAFSPDGSHLASGASDRTIRVWRLPHDLDRDYPCTPSESRHTYCAVRLVGHAEAVWSVAYSPVGGALATAAADGLVLVWRLKPGPSGAPDSPLLLSMRRAQQQESKESSGGLSDEPDGGSSADGGAGADYVALAGSQGYVKAVCFSPDGSRVASGGADHTVRVWCPRTGRVRMELFGHAGPVTCVAYSPDGSLLASGSADDTVHLWAALSANAVTPADGAGRGDAAPRGGGADAPDGVLRCAPLRTLRGTDSVPRAVSGAGAPGVMALAFTPAGGGDTIAVVGANRVTKVWAVVPRGDDVDPAPFVLAGAHRDYTFAVTFSPHGSSVITGSRDGTAVVWRRAPVLTPPRDGVATTWALDLKRKPDADGEAHNEPPPPRRSPLKNPAVAHRLPVRFAQFTPSGDYLLTVSNDAACVWDCSGVAASARHLGSEARFLSAERTADHVLGPLLVSPPTSLERGGKNGADRDPKSAEWRPGLAEAAFAALRPVVMFSDGSALAIPFDQPLRSDLL